MSFFKKCPFCKKRRIYIAKRKIELPTKLKITSEKEMCRKCYKQIKNIK